MHIECAPMAGYTDINFRRVLVECGARVVWTEMVSAAAIFYGNKKTLGMLEHDKAAGVKNVLQLFGKDPKHFEFAISSGAPAGFDEININMGCPANKIIKNSEGAALMKKPDLAREIIQACVRVSPVPVSVKMRLGDRQGYDYVAFARMCEDAGAARLIVHGRRGDQGFRGAADWNAIGEIVRAVKIPVIANGDIRTADDARRCLDVTGAAGVMVGRALLPLYRKYFPRKLQILRGEKICVEGGVVDCVDNLFKFLMQSD
jgi:tRNA-dihydrouridine synthase B